MSYGAKTLTQNYIQIYTKIKTTQGILKANKHSPKHQGKGEREQRGQQVQREEWACPENRLSFSKQVGTCGQTVRGHGSENCLRKVSKDSQMSRVGYILTHLIGLNR